jgi:predicted nucleic acid-binding protein
MRSIKLLRVTDRVLSEAGQMEPVELRSLDAIHVASASQLGEKAKEIVTDSERMAAVAKTIGWSVVSPSE